MSCPICFSEEEEKIYVELPCKHKCCLECFTLLKKFECMLCRKPLEYLVPEILKKKYTAKVNPTWYNPNQVEQDSFENYLSLLGSRLQRDRLRSRRRSILYPDFL